MGRLVIRILAYVSASGLLLVYAGFVYISWYFQPLRNAVLLVADERGAVYLKREAVGWDRDQMALSARTIGSGRPITCCGLKTTIRVSSLQCIRGPIRKIG